MTERTLPDFGVDMNAIPPRAFVTHVDGGTMLGHFR